MKKNYLFLVASVLLVFFTSCGKMEDNYAGYLEKEHIYPPKVNNLVAYEGLREVSLTWDNPPGEIARKIWIDYEDDTLLIDHLVDSVHIDSLEIKGYTISVYTLDAYNNRSVPETVNIFPNGENQ